MPSTTRGSILISTANDIGEALVEKLGGVGYSPNEWKDKFNLCGIAPVDSAPALSVLADSAGTGDERGSILIATADAIGAILNKKYNVLRGFKPKEWASACRKMKALEEGSVASASIASFPDGADAVPIKSWEVTLPASLDGYSEVNGVQTGRNLVDDTNFTRGLPSTTIGASIETISASTRYAYFDIDVKGGIFTVSPVSNDTTYYNLALIWGYTNGVLSYYGNALANTPKTVDLSACDHVRVGVGSSGGAYRVPTNLEGYGSLQFEVGSTAHAYKHYQTPTQYTASLGRTIHGGQADIVNGEGKETAYLLDDFTDVTVINNSTTSGSRTFRLNTPSGHYRAKDLVILSNLFTVKPLSSAEPYCVEVTDASSNPDVTHGIYFSLPLSISGAVEARQWLIDNGATFLYSEETPTDFTFTPITPTPETALGVNNFWSEQGNTAVEYYKAPTPYARKTATGGVANFSDQRTDLPLTKAIANIAPSIAGKSAVNLYQGKKNLYNAPVSVNIPSGGGNVGLYDCYFKKGVTYTYSAVTSNQAAFVLIGLDKNGTEVLRTSSPLAYTGAHSLLFTPTEDIYKFRIYYNAETTITDIMVEVGSTASTFEPYQDPTTYTAELGETVYGGSVDFVSGEVVNDCAKDSMSSSYLSGLSLETYIGYEAQTAYFNYHPSIWVRNWNYQTAAARTAGGIKCACDEFPVSMNNTTIFASQYRIYFDVNGKNISSVQDFIDYVANLEQNGKQLEITYELATPTESTIPGRVISPIEGVNNYWNDAGGDTEIQYFENET